MKTDTSPTDTKPEIDFLAEWAIWAHLDGKTDWELMLLKGHLLIEMILGIVLARNEVRNTDNYSFHRKIGAFENIMHKDQQRKDFIVAALRELNQIRNKLAHEFKFDVKDGALKQWSQKIMDNLQGTKFTKFTLRTRTVHAFSILASQTLDLDVV